MRLPCYERYADTKLPWAPKLPAHWQVLRNGRLFSQRVETGFPDLPILEVSLNTGVRVRDLANSKRKQVMSDKEKYKRALKGDIAYNMMRMWQGAVGTAPVDGLISPAYVVAKPFAETNSSYYSYLFRTADYKDEVNKYSRGIVSDRNRLYWDEFKQMPSIVPPRDEQDRIVAYLRAQDAHIARFIKAKRELIGLLNEQKQTLIHQAVTKGIDPNVTMKPSGIDWFGDVPENWKKTRIRACISDAINGVWGEEPNDKNQDDHIECVRVADFDMDTLSVKNKNLTIRAVSLNERLLKKVVNGDLIIEKSGGGDKTPVGRVIKYNLNRPAVCSNFTARLTPNNNLILNDYLLLIFNLLHENGIVKPWIKQTTGIQNLDIKSYFSMSIYLPGLQVQEQILSSLKINLAPIFEAGERAKQEISLILEWRETLIKQVVTGQIDLRDWRPGPDDNFDDNDLNALSEGDESMDEEDEDESD